jgi:hypothetical protein
MKKIHILTSTGNRQGDQVLAGVYGTYEAGVFTPAPEFSQISSIFENLAASTDVSVTDPENVKSFEVPDVHLDCIQANLVANMGDRWAAMYQQLTPEMNGPMRLMVQAEERRAMSGVSARISQANATAWHVPITQTVKITGERLFSHAWNNDQSLIQASEFIRSGEKVLAHDATRSTYEAAATPNFPLAAMTEAASIEAQTLMNRLTAGQALAAPFSLSATLSSIQDQCIEGDWDQLHEVKMSGFARVYAASAQDAQTIVNLMGVNGAYAHPAVAIKDVIGIERLVGEQPAQNILQIEQQGGQTGVQTGTQTDGSTPPPPAFSIMHLGGPGSQFDQDDDGDDDGGQADRPRYNG